MDIMSFVPPLSWPSTSVDGNNTFSKRAFRICHENERNNLLAIFHLVLNSLLDDSIRSNRMLLEGVETREISDFFVMFEKVIWHGFRTSSSLLAKKRPEAQLWNLIGQTSEGKGEMGNLYESVNEMSNLSSPLAKMRAFWRLALVQKRLSDYFNAIFEFNGKNPFYEHWAFMRCDSCCAFLTGSLLALNAFDFDLSIENDHLEEQINSFELAPYFRLPTLPGHVPNSAKELIANGSAGAGDASISGDELALVLSQKQYLEERNRQLCAINGQLKMKLEQLKAQNGNRNMSNGPLEGEGQPLTFTDRLRDLERERDILRARLAEKEDSVRTSHEQLTDMKKFTEDLYEKLKTAESRVKRLKSDICQLNELHEKEVNALNASLCALHQNEGEEAMEEKAHEKRLREELVDKTKQYMEVMSAVKRKQQEVSEEREQNATLRRRVTEQEARAETMAKTEKELLSLKEEHRRSKQQLLDCQMALQEFSEALSESKLRMVELKEEIMPLSEAAWVEDSRVVQCRMCDVQFGVWHRKHHCRNCGQIFCNECSSGRVKMPSSAQPVRVCLNCFHLLRNRQLSVTSIVHSAGDGTSPSASSLVGLR